MAAVAAWGAAEWIMAGAVVAGTAYSVHETNAAAAEQKAELKNQQRQEEAAARDREIQRQQRTKAIIGSQAAIAAASGVEMSGSVSNITLTDLKTANRDTITDNYNTRLRLDALSRQSRSIGRAANARNATTIMSAGERLYGVG